MISNLEFRVNQVVSVSKETKCDSENKLFP